MSELLVILLPGVLVALCYLFFETLPDWRSRRANRRREVNREAEAKKAARLADGLPPHERCICSECRAWRSVPGNQELLRLRGGGQ